MRYLGGKSRISKPISEVINNAISGRQIKNIETDSINPLCELGGADHSFLCSVVVVQ